MGHLDDNDIPKIEPESIITAPPPRESFPTGGAPYGMNGPTERNGSIG